MQPISLDIMQLIHDVQGFIIIIFDSDVFSFTEEFSIYVKFINRIIIVLNPTLKSLDLRVIKTGHTLQLTFMRIDFLIAFAHFCFELLAHVFQTFSKFV